MVLSVCMVKWCMGGGAGGGGGGGGGSALKMGYQHPDMA